MDALLVRLGLVGVGSYASAGDFGSTCNGQAYAGVAWPASSPFVTAVGGTQLTLNGANQRTAEVVWNDLAILSANHRRAHRPPVGPANGLLYYLAKRAPSTIFDVVSGNNTYLRRVPGFSAKPGYDLASGLGVRNSRRWRQRFPQRGREERLKWLEPRPSAWRFVVGSPAPKARCASQRKSARVPSVIRRSQNSAREKPVAGVMNIDPNER